MPLASCPECNGTGWKIVERDELSGAAKCGCVDPDRTDRIISSSGIPQLYAGASFENFDRRSDMQLTHTWQVVQSYARLYPWDLKKRGLLLMGDSGTGKTHLAVAAFRALLAKGHEGLFFDYQNLLDRIRSGYDPASNSSDRETYRVAMEADILLLDDLGAHRVTDWVEDTVTSILTYRCNNSKPLIATTNLIDGDAGDATLEKNSSGKIDYRTTLTERIGARARSRLFEMCRVVKMPLVEDFRVRMKEVS